MEMMGFAGSTHRTLNDLRSDASRAIDLAWKRDHNGIGRCRPEREVTTGAARFKLRHYLCSRALWKIGAIAVIKTDLSDVYRDYIACLNKQDWPKLGQFVDDEVIHNGRRVGLSGYLEMLERDFDEIPDLHFNIQLLISDPPYIASRLGFDCTPKGTFLGLHVNGKRVSFTENVIYEFRSEKIVEVWSVIDKAAIEAQL
jgi:predicted ester cyclase